MTKRQEAHILAVIKGLEKEKARLDLWIAPHELALRQYDELTAVITERLSHARALLGVVDAPQQGETPQNAPAPLPEGKALRATYQPGLVLRELEHPMPDTTLLAPIRTGSGITTSR